MLVTVLFGSPRRDGATARAARDFLSALPDGAAVDFFDLYAVGARPCIDCGACRDGRCIYRDLDRLFASCLASDLLLIASPVYNYSVPAPLKAVFDRCQPYYYRNFNSLHAPTDPARRGGLFLTAGRGGAVSFDLIRRQTRVFFQNLQITYAFERFFPHTDAPDFSPDACRTADIARALFGKGDDLS